MLNEAEETANAKLSAPTRKEEQRARIRQRKRVYREKLKANGYSFSQAIGWTKDWDETCDAIKAYREAAKTSAFKQHSTLEKFFFR